MKQIVVTGATGYLGSQTLTPLLAAGFDVHAVTSREPPASSDSGIFWHRLNLFDAEAVDAFFDRLAPSHLLHLAWDVTPPGYWTSTENIRWVQCSLSVAMAFHRAGGQRAVYAGSCAEYDWSQGTLAESTTPSAPSTLYGTCKNALREMLLALDGPSTAWGRIFHSFGPGEHPSRLVPSLASALLAGRKAPCSHGRQLRDFLDVRDLGAAFVALLTSEVRGTVNVASGQPVAVGEIASILGRLSGHPELLEPGAIAEPKSSPALLVADVRRLTDEVGWKPAIPLEAGLAHAIEWWRGRPE